MKTTILIVILLFSLVSNAQRELDPDDYFEHRYWNEAIVGYSKQLEKAKSTEEQIPILKKIALSSFYAKKYEFAQNYFGKVQHLYQDFTKAEKEAYFQTLRTVGQYDKARSIVSDLYEDEKIQNQLTVFPKADDSSLEGQLYEVFDVSLDFGSYFLGATPYKKGLLVSVPEKDKEGRTSFFDLHYVENETDTTFKAVERNSIVKGRENIYYRATPTTIDSNLIVYSKNISSKSWYSPVKAEKQNIINPGENILHLFEYDLTSLIEKDISVNIEGFNFSTPFYLPEKKILFYSSNCPGGKGGYDIYYVLKIDTGWSRPVNLEIINTEFDDVYPFVMDNEIYFSSGGHENYGGLDIFFSKVNFSLDGLNVICENPINVGSPINSSTDDFSIFWLSKSKGYFASNRSSKEGKDKLYQFNYKRFDILAGNVYDQSGNLLEAQVSVYLKNNEGDWDFIETKKLGKDGKIEYQVDLKEIYRFDISYDGKNEKTMYFPDENAGGLRFDSKEYFSKIILDDAKITSRLIDQVTGKPIQDVLVEIYEIVDGIKKLVGTATTDENGNWDFAFDRSKDYEVNMKKRGYDAKTFEIPSSKRKRNRQDFVDDMQEASLTPEAKKEAIIRIDNIYFDFNSADIKSESYPILDNIIAFLTTKPEVKIEIGAHTDAIGSDSYNYKLSVKRAKSCYNYLVNKGIDPQRLRSKGYGETKILNGCGNRNKCSDEENAINRRIEIKVL